MIVGEESAKIVGSAEVIQSIEKGMFEELFRHDAGIRERSENGRNGIVAAADGNGLSAGNAGMAGAASNPEFQSVGGGFVALASDGGGGGDDFSFTPSRSQEQGEKSTSGVTVDLPKGRDGVFMSQSGAPAACGKFDKRCDRVAAQRHQRKLGAMGDDGTFVGQEFD